MSQPAKGTMRPPRARCSASRGLCIRRRLVTAQADFGRRFDGGSAEASSAERAAALAAAAAAAAAPDADTGGSPGQRGAGQQPVTTVDGGPAPNSFTSLE